MFSLQLNKPKPLFNKSKHMQPLFNKSKHTCNQDYHSIPFITAIYPTQNNINWHPEEKNQPTLVKLEPFSMDKKCRKSI